MDFTMVDFQCLVRLLAVPQVHDKVADSNLTNNAKQKLILLTTLVKGVICHIAIWNFIMNL